MFCPACGVPVTDLMEAHTVGLAPSLGEHKGHRLDGYPSTSPAGWVVAWPCGCTLAPRFARDLLRIP